MDEFYSTTTTYLAFEEPVDQSGWFALFEPQIGALLRSKERIRVLELGAGRSVFGTFARKYRDRMTYHAQDVTAKNREHLQAHADRVHIGDMREILDSFDLIFHTFVFEHVSAPRPFLEQVKARLQPGGYHVVICPRYDLPGYVCPSMRHLGQVRRWTHSVSLAFSRLCARLDRSPRFWVNDDPAMLHVPWYRDADAVHLVSRFDVEQWHRRNGFTVTALNTGETKRPWLQRMITLADAYQKV
ncbi:MAG TPA: class I SAM-dependent methyltransferase [Phycisphaerae bacterium]|nr:class I SAM-dependent methyltransferase [Phycisphaerae bacterium]